MAVNSVRHRFLTPISLVSHKWDLANSADPDQNTASKSGSTPFAHRNFYKGLNEKSTH